MADIPAQSRTLQENLEAEFCPQLDSSLVAALVAEFESYNTNGANNPSPSALQSLRDTLSTLAMQADVDENLFTDAIDNMNISCISTSTDETESTLETSEYTTSGSGSSSSGSAQILQSPLAFLQAAFPYLSTPKLRKALADASRNDEDMEKIVEGLLSEEYVRELEERGIEDEPSASSDIEDWSTVAKRRKNQARSPTGYGSDAANNRKKKKARTMTLVDVRQKQHTRLPMANGSSRAAGGPWVQLSSLSTHLATLLHPHPASLFQSSFHSPSHPTPAMALRACLRSIAKSGSSSLQNPSLLFGLLEVLCSSPENEDLDSESHAQLLADAELALSATNGQSTEALDVLLILRDLERDHSTSQLGMGLYHSPAPSPTSQSLPSSPLRPATRPLASSDTNLTSAAPDRLVPPNITARPKPPPAPNQSWQFVHPRRTAPKALHPLAASIPAYNPYNFPRKLGGPGNNLGKGGKGDVGELGEDGSVRRSGSERCREYRQKRVEMLREASRYWQSGTSKTRGGEVALYFAERAREYQEQSRMLALEAARERVQSKRLTSSELDTIDLHGVTSAEAVAIVNDVLSEGWASSARPLRIITGKGSHSAGRVGVLGPVVKNFLEANGWTLGKWEGGIIVRGKSRG